MKSLRVALVAAALAAACGGSHGQQLWLALNGDELHVKLQPIEPNPY